MRRSDQGDGYEMDRYWSEVHRLDSLRNIDELSLVMHHDLPRYYNILYDRLERRAYSRAWRRAGIPARGLCVEIGPGRGRFTRRLAQRGLDLFGLDISETAVQRLRQRFPRCRFEVGSAERVPLADRTVDVVSSVVVLLHLPPPEKIAAILEIGRILRPGGFAILIESTHTTDAAPHVFPLSVEAWTAVFRDAGLACAYHRGQEFVPLLRLAENLHRRAVDSRELPPRLGRSLLRAGDRLLRSRVSRRPLVALSYPIELVAEIVSPPRLARHGVFVFRKPDAAESARIAPAGFVPVR